MKALLKKLILFLLIVFPVFSMAQGYLMLAGGASESVGGWSDAPYRWVVEHAQNKRIAIITYDNAATDWIPNYFRGFGAKRARNFIISNRASADIQSLYDSLITYNGVFIKGGDQKNYYDYYKGTKTQQALQYIYNNGGVLSGTSAGTAILSPIVYTAQVASVDPSTALLYAYSNQITLANDFLTTLTNKYIFDTHFIERGRFGRLPSFMATWFKKSKENTTGIGVDDHTAICIDPDGKAKIYGTAAINFFYNTDSSNPYDTTVTIMRTKTMKLTQLIHGSTIDLNNGNITGLNKYIEPKIKEENGRYTILFNGSDYPIDDAYSYFVNSLGS
jgi:cyanophycinase